MREQINSELMFKKYWKPGMSIKTYSKLIGCNRPAAYEWLKVHHPEVINAVVKLNSEENFQKYWKNGMSFADYGRIIGVSVAAVGVWMNIHHPEIVRVHGKTNFNMGYKINEYLFDRMYKPGMNLSDIATSLNCKEITVSTWCKKFRPKVYASFLKINPIRLTEKLFQKYWKDGMTKSEFSEITGVHYGTVNWWLNKYHPEVVERKLKVREKLFKKYWRDGMTTSEYANAIGCSKSSAVYWLKRYHPEVCIPKIKKRSKDRNSDTSELFKLYWTKEITIEKFAKICRISYNAMQQWLYQNHPEVLFKHVFKRTKQHV